jgi:hypothetical protein
MPTERTDYVCTDCEVSGFGACCWACGGVASLRVAVYRDAAWLRREAAERMVGLPEVRTSRPRPTATARPSSTPSRTSTHRVHDSLVAEMLA